MKSIVAEFTAPIYNEEMRETRDMLSELQLEIQLILIECEELVNTLYIYKHLMSKEYCANTLLYSEYYTTIKNSMVYRIVLGFSKLFGFPSYKKKKRFVILNIICLILCKC